MIEINLQSHTFILLPQKAVFWKEKKSLLISDLHLGKVSHFRKNGIAFPKESANKDLEKLQDLILAYTPETIIFLGDLFHSNYNNEWESFVQLRNHFSTINFILIKGNHDIIKLHHFIENEILVYDTLLIDDILFSHEMAKNKNYHFQFYGHTHPGIKLKGLGKLSVTLACFAQLENALLMPAFGELTGLHIIDRKDYDKIYAIAEDKIFAV